MRKKSEKSLSVRIFSLIFAASEFQNGATLPICSSKVKLNKDTDLDESAWRMGNLSEGRQQAVLSLDNASFHRGQLQMVLEKAAVMRVIIGTIFQKTKRQ